jgi:sulfur carrier protein ThiS
MRNKSIVNKPQLKEKKLKKKKKIGVVTSISRKEDDIPFFKM